MTLFSTKEFYLSAYLIASGVPMRSHQRLNNVPNFCFEDSERLHELVEEYYSPSCLVNPVAYGNALRNLKSIIHANIYSNSKEIEINEPNHTINQS